MSTTHNHKARTKPKKTKQMRLTSAGVVRTAGVLEPIFPTRQTVLNCTYSIIQTSISGQTLVSSTTVPTYGAIYFTLNSIDQSAQLTSVFDQYRIDMVEVCFKPRITMPTTASQNTGLFSTVVDVDDNNTLTSVNAAYDYENCVSGKGSEEQRRTLVPHCALAAYSGAFTSYANVASPWIDANSPAVVHYGVKTAWTVTDAVYTTDVLVRYKITFRNVR